MEQPQSILSRFNSETISVKLRGKEVKVHGLSTGSVAVKTSFKRRNGLGELAKLSILLDGQYTEYMPIWVWVIEHPEGIILIDTGENARILNIDAYLARESWFLRYQFKHAAKFDIDVCQELNHQLKSIYLDVEDVKLVVLTHLHLDHTDGLRFFPKQEIIVGDYEFKHANSNMPSTYPHWFKPNRVTYQCDRIEIFNHAYPITKSEDLLYIPTPGHTLGHSSVVFKTDDFDILFSGDASYDQEQVLRNEVAGVNADYKATLRTYRNILDYGKTRKTIYLPSHDKNSGQRLKKRSFIL